MKIDGLRSNINMGMKEKISANKGEFADGFMRSYKSATKEELESYIKEIKKKGNRLILTKKYSDVKNYKDTIRSYLKSVVHYTYTLNKDIAFWGNQYYSTVEVINEKLDELTKQVLEGEKENLHISSTIDIIQGLLVDIYK